LDNEPVPVENRYEILKQERLALTKSKDDLPAASKLGPLLLLFSRPFR